LRLEEAVIINWVKAGNKTKSEIQDEYFLAAIKIEFRATREPYGPRRLSKHLKQKGVTIGRERVDSMQSLGL
jgi:putative transposase